MTRPKVINPKETGGRYHKCKFCNKPGKMIGVSKFIGFRRYEFKVHKECAATFLHSKVK